jgi:hypothetical protein
MHVFNKLLKFLSYFPKVPGKLILAYHCIRSPFFRWVGPGHYYSPFPDMAEVGRRINYIYPPTHFDLAGIDLRAEEQKQLLLKFLPYYASPFIERHHNPSSRYFRPNGSFPFQDAFTLYAMLQCFKPKRLVEVGCGMSSCVILDSCEKLQLGTTLTFIDPHPDFMLQLIRPTDHTRFELRSQCIQDVPLEVFTQLDAGDILFIDTSHSSKIGSDVNHIFFRILPFLKKGVFVHFHDIWYPFEYPIDCLHRGMFWNEAYLLRAFLMFNQSFQIVLFNNFINQFMTDGIRASFPLFLDEPGGSIWLQRVF